MTCRPPIDLKVFIATYLAIYVGVFVVAAIVWHFAWKLWERHEQRKVTHA